MIQSKSDGGGLSLSTLKASLSEKVFQGPKVVVNRFGWNFAQKLGVMKYFRSQFGSVLWLLVLELQGGGLIFCRLRTKSPALQGAFWRSHKAPLQYIVQPNEFDHEFYYNRAFSLYMKLCPQGIEQRGAWGWSLAKIDVKITTPNSYFSKF